MIKSKKLLKFKEIQHVFFNKKGGKSKGIYSSLNCGIGSNDLKKNVLKNLDIVCNKIGISRKKLILLNQIHSNKFHFINKNYKISEISIPTVYKMSQISKLPPFNYVFSVITNTFRFSFSKIFS